MVVKRSLAILLGGLICCLTFPDTHAGSGNVERKELVLRGRVKSLEIDEYDPQVAVFIRITIEAQFVNTGSKPIILLKRNPLFVEAALTKEQAFDRRHLLAVDGGWPAISDNPEWISLRKSLDKRQPPEDETRVLKPKESWTVEATVGLTVPIDPKRYTSSRKKERLQVLQSLSPLWLWVTCEIWPDNVEGLARNRSQLPFGHKLQRRWSNLGFLWLKAMRSEPIPFDLSIATYKNKVAENHKLRRKRS